MALVGTDNLLKRFSRYLRLERGLSENTIAGYMSDVEKLVDLSTRKIWIGKPLQEPICISLSLHYKIWVSVHGRRLVLFRG